MKFLVTGGVGFIGTNLIKVLLKEYKLLNWNPKRNLEDYIK